MKNGLIILFLGEPGFILPWQDSQQSECVYACMCVCACTRVCACMRVFEVDGGPWLFLHKFLMLFPFEARTRVHSSL